MGLAKGKNWGKGDIFLRKHFYILVMLVMFLVSGAFTYLELYRDVGYILVIGACCMCLCIEINAGSGEIAYGPGFGFDDNSKGVIPLDKSILVECMYVKEEIRDLRKRIEDDRTAIRRLSSSLVTDSVSCGKKGKKPLRTVKITGYPKVDKERRENLLNKRIEKLARLENEQIELTIKAEEYIQSIQKSEIRMMLRFYFVDGLTYAKVAFKMNSMFPKRKVKYTDENIRKRIQRILENF
jgi:hypothetical protein